MKLDDSEIDTLLKALEALEGQAAYKHVMKAMLAGIMSRSKEEAKKNMEELGGIPTDRALNESLLLLKAKLIQMRPSNQRWTRTTDHESRQRSQNEQDHT